MFNLFYQDLKTYGLVTWKVFTVTLVITLSTPMILYQGLLDYFDKSMNKSFNTLLGVVRTQIGNHGWHMISVERSSELYDILKTDLYTWLIHIIIKVFILFPFIMLFCTSVVVFGIPIFIILSVLSLMVYLGSTTIISYKNIVESN